MINLKNIFFFLLMLSFFSCKGKEYIIDRSDLKKLKCVLTTDTHGFDHKYDSIESCTNSETFKKLSSNPEQFFSVIALSDEKKMECILKSELKTTSKVLHKKEFDDVEKCYDSDEFFYLRISKAGKRERKIHEYCRKIDKKLKKFCESALVKNVEIGMPEELVYLSLGNPWKTNSANYGSGVQKQIIYGGLYIYVYGGYVTSWQQN